MAKKLSGVIETMARNTKALKLEGSDDWYSVFKAVQMNEAKVGDTVSFEYEEKEKGGQTFRNIQGNVQVTKGAPESRNAGGGSSSNREISIVRQTALKAAATIIGSTMTVESKLEDATEDTIAMAQAFEAYVFSVEEE